MAGATDTVYQVMLVGTDGRRTRLVGDHRRQHEAWRAARQTLGEQPDVSHAEIVRISITTTGRVTR